MVYAVAPFLNLSRQDATKTAEPVSADRPYTFSKVIGRSIPIVIGTGKVDGIPVIGGATTIQTVTGYQTEQAASGLSQTTYPPGTTFTHPNGLLGGLYATIPTYSTTQAAVLGYLLAFDPFGDGYELVRLEVNDTVVYDAENGIGASTTFRFYGGNQTAVDPITTANIGANAGTWQHFAMVFLDGYAASSPPTVKAVISNAAGGLGDTGEWVLDFIKERYLHNGAPVALSTVIDKPSNVVARGLQIPDEDPGGVVSAIGAFLTDCLAMDWTIVIEWEELTTDGATYLLYLFEAPGGGDHWLVMERSTAFAGLRVDAHEGSYITRNVEIDTSHGPGIHRIAVTRTNDRLSISCDGSPVDTQAVSNTTMNPMATATFGGDTTQSFNGTYIRKVVLMAPQDDITLPALSRRSGEAPEIVWTGTVPGTFTDISGWYEAYDPSDSLIYHLLTSQDIPILTTVNLAVLDTQTLSERYRVPLENSDIYAVPDPATNVLQRPEMLALRGASHVLIRFSTDASVGVSRVYDATTGLITAEYTEPDTSTTIYWVAGQPFGANYVFMGWNRYFSSDQHVYFAVADITLGSLTVTESTVPFRETGIQGRQFNGSVSFFSCSTTVGEVYEHTFNGDSWVSALVYTDAGTVDGLRYDPLTGYLIISSAVSGNFFLRYVNPDTGSIVTSFSTSGKQLASDSFGGVGGYERFFSRPGYALWVVVSGSSEDVLLLDINAQTLTPWVGPIPHGTNWTGAIFDQTRGVYYSFYGDDHWTQYALTAGVPNSIALESVITKVMFLAGYSEAELTFSGFTGLSAYGFVIDQDTNVRTALQAVSDVYGFSFSDAGSGFYFKKAGRDSSFALDDTITTADLVFGDKSAVDSTDEAAIRSTMRVQLDYISKEQGYTSATVSFQMAPVTNSIRTDKYSTPLTLTDADAQKFVTDKYFELQAKLRTHSFSLTGKVEFLPGDVISLPSGAITYTVQVESIDLNRNLVADIQVTEFQTAVATTITPVTNSGLYNSIPVSLQTQYIHLDVPLFLYSDDLGGNGLKQYGIIASRGQQGWGGGALYQGDTATSLSAVVSQAPHNGVIATCISVLGNPLDPFGTADTSTVTIRRTSGDVSLLVDKTEAEVLAGSNMAYIGSAGRWEAVGYKTVTANADGSYTLSGFSRRGYRGTEVFCDAHQVGDQFVMVDPTWLKSINEPVSALGLSKYFKAIGLTQDISTGTVVQKQILGAAETPYACVNLNAEAITGGIELTWDYRSRLATGLNPTNFGEAALAFQIDIYDGATYKRTLTATTNSVLYADADVLSDFGSDPPAEMIFDVFMMSALPILVPGQARPVAGRGYRARRHFVFTYTPTFDSTRLTFDSTVNTFDQE